MIIRRLRMLSAFGLFLMVSCTDSTGAEPEARVRIVTGETIYAVGDLVHVTVENLGSTTIGMVPCPLLFEIRRLGSWHTAGVADGFAEGDCDAAIHPLDPGSPRTMYVRLQHDLAPGTYRLKIENIYSDAALFIKLPLGDRISNAFVLE